MNVLHQENTLSSDQTDLFSSKRVSVSGVGKRFGQSWAVRGLDFEIQGGEFISLLGPSGCGKTTTLRMIAGFEHPDEGEISIGGTPLGRTPPNRRPTNTVFQSYALFPQLTVAENVAYGLRQRRVPKSKILERVAHTLDLVRMRSFADRKPSQLSGGQQQRVALARAIVNKPSVLLLDEPMSALDRKLREEMQLELTLLQQELGITFIFVTHDQDEAFAMSNRIAVMNAGRIEQFATAAEIYDDPSSYFVASFVGQQNTFYGTTAAFDGTKVHITTEHGSVIGHSTHLSDQSTTQSKVVCTIRPEEVSINTVPEGSQNSVTGVLKSLSRVGPRTKMVVALPEGPTVQAFAPSPHTLPAPGSRVTCSWSVEAVNLYNI